MLSLSCLAKLLVAAKSNFSVIVSDGEETYMQNCKVKTGVILSEN